MKRYIFAADVDGTILMDDGQVHPATLEACKLARAQGHIIVLSTGRSVKRTLSVLKKLPDVDFFVCNNGTVVYDCQNDQDIFIKGLSPQYYPKIVDFARTHGFNFKLHTNRDWIGDVGIEDELPTLLTAELDQQIRHHIFTHPEDPYLFNGQIPTQMSVNASAELCAKYLHQFQNWFAQEATVFLANDIYIDVNPQGVSKWIGLEKLAHHLNLPTNQIVTFGDSTNDLEMLLGAKEHGYAMANSKPELAKVIPPKIGTNNSDAIAKTILRYIQSN